MAGCRTAWRVSPVLSVRAIRTAKPGQNPLLDHRFGRAAGYEAKRIMGGVGGIRHSCRNLLCQQCLRRSWRCRSSRLDPSRRPRGVERAGLGLRHAFAGEPPAGRAGPAGLHCVECLGGAWDAFGGKLAGSRRGLTMVSAVCNLLHILRHMLPDTVMGLVIRSVGRHLCHFFETTVLT